MTGGTLRMLLQEEDVGWVQYLPGGGAGSTRQLTISSRGGGASHLAPKAGRGNTQAVFPSLLEVVWNGYLFLMCLFVSGGAGRGMGFLRVG